MTNHNLIQIYQHFQKVIETSDLDFSLKRRVFKFLKLLEQDYNFLLAEEKKLIEKYAERDENGQVLATEQGIKFNASNGMLFRLEHLKMMELELDAQVPKFPSEVFDGIKCSLETMEVVNTMVEEEE